MSTGSSPQRRVEESCPHQHGSPALSFRPFRHDVYDPLRSGPDAGTHARTCAGTARKGPRLGTQWAPSTRTGAFVLCFCTLSTSRTR